MLKYYFILCVLCVTVSCQTWGSRTCLVDPLGYFTKVMQATVHEVETNIKWCNMKMDDLSTPVNVELYNWNVVGRVNYTNGFLVSIDRVDISNFLQSFSTRTVNDTQHTIFSFRGNLNLYLAKVGFDVDIDFEGLERQHVTGVFVYRLISWTFFIERDVNTNVTTVFTMGSSSSGETTRMEYMPASNLTEVASRFYFAYSSGNSFPRWGREITAIALEKAQEIEFPEIRFNNDC